MSGSAIGIHLGSAWLRCTTCQFNIPVPVLGPWGSGEVPFYYALDNEGFLLGNDAEALSFREPTSTAFGFLRFVTLPDSERKPRCEELHLSYEAGHDEQGVFLVLRRPDSTEREEVHIQSILRRYFRFVRENFRSVEESSSEPSFATISAPPNISISSYPMIKSAAEDAGFRDTEIISRTLASFVGWTQQGNVQPGTYLVVYLGSAYLQLAVVKWEHGNVQLITEHAPYEIGGDDFDAKILQYCSEIAKRDFRVDFMQEQYRVGLEGLRVRCRKAKHELSSFRTTLVRIPGLIGTLDFVQRLTRDSFEELCKEEITAIGEYLFAESRELDLAKITEIIPCGGASRMPFLQYVLRDIFGSCPINQNIRPYADVVSAKGTAVRSSSTVPLTERKTSDSEKRPSRASSKNLERIPSTSAPVPQPVMKQDRPDAPGFPDKSELTEAFVSKSDATHDESGTSKSVFVVVKVFQLKTNPDERFLELTDPATQKVVFAGNVTDMVESVGKRSFNIFYKEKKESTERWNVWLLEFKAIYEAIEFRFATERQSQSEETGRDEVFASPLPARANSEVKTESKPTEKQEKMDAFEKRRRTASWFQKVFLGCTTTPKVKA